MDDFIILDDNWEQDLQMVAVVLESPRQDSQPTPKKCVIGRGEIQCLGTLLAQRQVCPQLAKSIAITTCLRLSLKNNVGWATWPVHFSLLVLDSQVLVLTGPACLLFL